MKLPQGRQVRPIPVTSRNARLNKCVLQIAGNVVARRQPVVVRLELCGDHAFPKVFPATQTIQVKVAHLHKIQVEIKFCTPCEFPSPCLPVWTSCG